MINQQNLLLTLFVILIQSNIYAININIIPCPNEIKLGKDSFLIDNNIQIIASEQSEKTALYLKDQLKNNIKVVKKLPKKGVSFISFKNDNILEKEAYKLEVKKKSITITSSDDAGRFYGVQSLLQLIEKNKIQEVTINDSPRFSWRAFMLDEARYFKGKEQVKLLLDEMARLKMNVFHWHLVDDEGWRIKIKKYPLLTKVGSTRESSQLNYRVLRWKSPVQSGEKHSGYYTQDDIREVVKYAQERHITIIPEIEMSGHSSAAIAAYPYLGTKKKKNGCSNYVFCQTRYL